MFCVHTIQEFAGCFRLIHDAILGACGCPLLLVRRLEAAPFAARPELKAQKFVVCGCRRLHLEEPKGEVIKLRFDMLCHHGKFGAREDNHGNFRGGILLLSCLQPSAKCSLGGPTLHRESLKPSHERTLFKLAQAASRYSRFGSNIEWSWRTTRSSCRLVR